MDTATIHAFFVINSHKAEVRSNKTLKAINNQTEAIRKSMNEHSEISARQAQAQIEISARQAHAQIELSKAQLATQVASVPQRVEPVKMIEEIRYQVSRNNEVIGAWTKNEIRSFLNSGNLGSGDWAWDANSNSWIKIDQFIS